MSPKKQLVSLNGVNTSPQNTFLEYFQISEVVFGKSQNIRNSKWFKHIFWKHIDHRSITSDFWGSAWILCILSNQMFGPCGFLVFSGNAFSESSGFPRNHYPPQYSDSSPCTDMFVCLAIVFCRWRLLFDQSRHAIISTCETCVAIEAYLFVVYVFVTKGSLLFILCLRVYFPAKMERRGGRGGQLNETGG